MKNVTMWTRKVLIFIWSIWEVSQYRDVIWSQKSEDKSWPNFHLRDVEPSSMGSGLKILGPEAGSGRCTEGRPSPRSLPATWLQGGVKSNKRDSGGLQGCCCSRKISRFHSKSGRHREAIRQVTKLGSFNQFSLFNKKQFFVVHIGSRQEHLYTLKT